MVGDVDHTAAIEVYWRPACLQCMRLRTALHRYGVPLREHNIWRDDEARAFVRSVNGGDETVPTVVVGDRTMTNPKPREVMRAVESSAPHLLPVGWRTRRRGPLARLFERAGS